MGNVHTLHKKPRRPSVHYLTLAAIERRNEVIRQTAAAMGDALDPIQLAKEVGVTVAHVYEILSTT